ncbi:hypothetical protein CO614_07115 [Lysobacteraceae bacterium NML120232]|nr:hypothetical protein CO614_07115 [Xanthomonadaceae bacterium NML120232]
MKRHIAQVLFNFSRVQYSSQQMLTRILKGWLEIIFYYLDLISKRPGKSRQAAETKLVVIGFSDICGDAAEVMETSRKRALLVERVLIDYGLPSDAIKQVRWHGVEGLSMFQASESEGECQNPWMNMVNVGLFFAH